MRYIRFVFFALMGIVLIQVQASPAHADACDAAIAAVNDHAERDEPGMAAIEKKIESTETVEELEELDVKCEFAKIELAFFREALLLKLQSERACGNRLKTSCNSSCVRQRISAAERKVADECAAPRPRQARPQAPVCTTPPAPSARRTSPTYMCFTAKNTNSDSRCVYSFTYRLSNRANPQAGQTLQAGASSSPVCTLQEGVNISFEKWTRVQSSAR